MTEELKETLIALANRFENKKFLEKDPSRFMHQFSAVEDVEIVAFLAANLAFGRRDQILLHIQMILDEIKTRGDRPVDWVMSKKYLEFFVAGEKSFYRMYTHNDMILFFDTIHNMIAEKGTIGEFVKEKWNDFSDCDKEGDNKKDDNKRGDRPLYLHQLISSLFPVECKLIPHSKESSAKKLNMLLRWLVRSDSPVDLGLWNWYSKSKLLMPLDTHVLQESVRFGILASAKQKEQNVNGVKRGQTPPSFPTSTVTEVVEEKNAVISRGTVSLVPSATLKTAEKLTSIMNEVFPEDPVRGDFALFGIGVTGEENR